MNKTEQANQLILAAELLKTGHPWECSVTNDKWIKNMENDCPLTALAFKREIRPILATPPDNRPLHNPDNLTAEQVGLGYRLTLVDEETNENEALQEFWNKGEWMTSGRVYSDTFGEAPNHRITYRLPLSVPWPEAKLDPYAELKAAHAAGKAIETQMPNGEWFDYKPGDPQWNLQPECYRIKSEPPAFQLPPPPPGMRWHYESGYKAGDLPQGYRPLMEGEIVQNGDEVQNGDMDNGIFVEAVNSIGYTIGATFGGQRGRTTRPLVFQHEGKEWTWHRPGDPMPCDGERKVYALFNDLEIRGASDATMLGWGTDVQWQILGWRYAETTKTVELGPEDVIAKLKEAIVMIETLANAKA